MTKCQHAMASQPGLQDAATLNLCAGPGGWEQGARILGVDLGIVGVDTSDDACATATAAGHRRISADVRALHPGYYPGVTGLIASPPCPTLSRAGRGSAERTGDLQWALDSIASFGAGCGCDWAGLPDHSTDIRTALMVEPARWALLLPNLQWMAAEQVPGAEFAFEDIAAELFAAGWESVDLVVLDAADYGCSARRRRVFLCANRTRPIDLLLGHPARPVARGATFAQALGWEPGHRVRTRAQRRPTGGNLFSADTIGWCLTEKMRSWERDADRRRFTPAEAGVLQGFPADYPWSGSRTSQFKQAGDVVAPPGAAAVIGAAIGIEPEQVERRIRSDFAVRSGELRAVPGRCHLNTGSPFIPGKRSRCRHLSWIGTSAVVHENLLRHGEPADNLRSGYGLDAQIATPPVAGRGGVGQKCAELVYAARGAAGQHCSRCQS